MVLQNIAEYFRFCPNQVEVKISDAVCIGRRRANYPYCRGCQFNDDEKARAAVGREPAAQRKENPAAMIEQVFKAYDVRATYPEPLSESVAWRIGYAAGQFMLKRFGSSTGGARGDSFIVVGRDMRTSSPSLLQALVEGVRGAGVGVVDIGMIDTPQIYFAVNQLGAMGGIQTTASHNPAHYNGFKLCGRGGVPIGENSGLQDVATSAAEIQKGHAEATGSYVERTIANDYKAFVLRELEPIRPLRAVIDASNGMAGKWAPLVLGDVANLSLQFLNLETTGSFVHEPNPLVDENLNQIREEVRRTGADFGACFDGDADRCIFVDEHAEVVRCDILTALLARWFLKKNPGATVVYDLRSSRVVPEEIVRHGGKPRRERVGHAFIKKAMAETDGVFGGELSGHFYFKDNFYCDSGLLALVHVLNVLTVARRSLSTLVNPLKRYASSGERNFQTPDKDGTIRILSEHYRDAKVDFLDGITVHLVDWWFNVRKSNTEPLLRLNMEANSPELLQQRLKEVAPLLGKPAGGR